MSDRTKGSYHCELGDFPATLIHEIAGLAAVTVDFPERRQTIHVPIDDLDLAFTARGKGKSRRCSAKLKELTAAHKKRTAADAADRERRIQAGELDE